MSTPKPRNSVSRNSGAVAPDVRSKAAANQTAAQRRVLGRTRHLLSWDNGKAAHPKPGENYTYPDPD